MRVNRILITALVVLAVIIFYEVRLKPQSRPLYESALVLYRQGKYNASLLDLQRAYQIEPNSTAILVLTGWNQLKLRQYEQARENFGRAARLDPTLTEAKLGLAYVALETGQGEAPVAGVQAMLAEDPSNRDFQLAAGVALRQAGRNLEALPILKSLLGSDKYGALARKHLEEMYGIEKLNEEIPDGLPPPRRSGQLRVDFRANGKYLQRRAGNAWENLYVKGINIGPAMPGSFASEPPMLVEDYLPWFGQIAELGANTVRAYTILPPAFYRALKRHNETPNLPRLYLLQEVWLADSEEKNLFTPATEKTSRQEVAYVLDLIHGQGNLPMRKGMPSGLYAVDVSEYVLGLLIGRELEPHLVVTNNEWNSFRKSYAGKYISIPEGNPTEVWLASLMDYAVGYEVDKYNQQRPLSIVNWPPLDPLSHPTEAGLQLEFNLRKKMGERLGELPPVFDDNDTVSVDSTKLRAGSGFSAGVFASYHVYPFYPDFLLHDPVLLRSRDHAGPNPYFGYLKALKGHYSKMPLLIAEYGVPTSIGVSHFHPYGWNHGGLNEREQGELLGRMTRNIVDAGCAGGIVFEWQDEWFKLNWLTAPFEMPLERRSLWLNALDPEENFGLWTYETSQSRLFSAVAGAAWNSVKPLYQKSGAPPIVTLNDGADAHRTLSSLAVSSDEAYLYLRLSVQSLPRGADGAPQLDRANYLIGLSTRPGHYGSRLLPGLAPHLRNPQGFNFLLHVAGAGNTRLLIASNYNPYALLPVEGVSNRVSLEIRSPWKPVLDDWSSFEDIVVESNRLRFSRDGAMFPPQRYSRSLLRYGPLDPNARQYDSLATWSADFQNNALVFRLPWSLLFVTDPSSRQIYAGAEAGAKLQTAGTEGLDIFAVSFNPGKATPDWGRFPVSSLAVTDTLPPADRQGTLIGIQRYRWQDWNVVKLSGRLKASARTLQKIFRELKG